MQSCVQNITTVRYLLDLYKPTLWHQPFGTLCWQQPFMPTPSHCKSASIEAPSPKKTWKSISLSTLQNLIGSRPN